MNWNIYQISANQQMVALIIIIILFYNTVITVTIISVTVFPDPGSVHGAQPVFSICWMKEWMNEWKLFHFSLGWNVKLGGIFSNPWEASGRVTDILSIASNADVMSNCLLWKEKQQQQKQLLFIKSSKIF